MRTHRPLVKVTKEQLISLTIEYIMTVNAYAVDKNELVAEILAKQSKEK